LSEFPVTEQIVGESDWKVTGAPLDAVALNARVLDASVALVGALNETVCAVRVIWKVNGVTSDAR
jgi:hypothetical protein